MKRTSTVRAIVPRILGQKKVRDETSAHNSLTVEQFLSRYEDVAPFILQQLSPAKASGEVSNELHIESNS